MTGRAIVIKTAGDPQIAGAICNGMQTAKAASINADYKRLQAVNGVRAYGDQKRWNRTQMRLARKYYVKPAGRVSGAILGLWGWLWMSIYGWHNYLAEWNREK